MIRTSYKRIEVSLATMGSITLNRNGQPELPEHNGRTCTIFHAGKCNLQASRPVIIATPPQGWDAGADEASAPQIKAHCAVCPVAKKEHTELIQRGKMVGWTTVQSTTLYNPNSLDPSTTIANPDGTVRLTLTHYQTTATVLVAPTYVQGEKKGLFAKLRGLVNGR